MLKRENEQKPFQMEWQHLSQARTDYFMDHNAKIISNANKPIQIQRKYEKKTNKALLKYK